MVAAAPRATARTAWRMVRARRIALSSEKVAERHEPADEGGDGQSCHQVEVVVDDRLDARAELAHQQGDDEEARAAGQDREENEPAQVIAGKARRDGYELVGDR